MLGTLPDCAADERSVHTQKLCMELTARPRRDGRREADVASCDRLSPAPPLRAEPASEPLQGWSSGNGPTAAVPLDALESELRELVVLE